MKLYTVIVPVWGHYTVEIEASSEDEAIDLAEEDFTSGVVDEFFERDYDIPCEIHKVEQLND